MKRNEPTLVEKAIQTVDGFDRVYKTLHQQTVMRGQSKSTLSNYIRRIAIISLHFNRLPENISDDQINEYLTSLALDAKSPSRSSFKKGNQATLYSEQKRVEGAVQSTNSSETPYSIDTYLFGRFTLPGSDQPKTFGH